MQRLSEDVVLEAEIAIEHVPATRPPVFDFLWHPHFARPQGVLSQLIEQILIDRIRLLTDDRETTKRH